MKRPEQALHLAVARYLTAALRPPTLWSSIDHAARLGPVAASMRKARGVRAGLPDVLVLHPGPIVIGIELKSPHGKASASQEAMQAAFEACGCRYKFCWELEDVVYTLEKAGIPLHAKLS